MEDVYTGDVGDFGKLGLRRAICKDQELDDRDRQSRHLVDIGPGVEVVTLSVATSNK